MLIQADARALPLGDGCVDCCITSPPYFGLRDYGHSGQIGLEPSPDAYVAALVGVFREVRRVLNDSGVCWLNLGDSYAGAGPSGISYQSKTTQRRAGLTQDGAFRISPKLSGCALTYDQKKPIPPAGLKSKDLMGIPWRVAFALQADGWVLRSDIVWAKPNPMPESVTDRPTKSHEMLFLLTKAKWVGPERGRFAHVSDADARWLALLIDAEGCIVVKRVQHEGRGDTFAPQVAVSSTSIALMERVVSMIGHGRLTERPGKNAPMWCLQMANNIAADFLRRIYPFLIIKQRQARIGIYVDALTYYRGGKKPERKQRTDAELSVLSSLWARGKMCNQFGHPDLTDVPEPAMGRWDSQPYHYDAAAIAEDSSLSMYVQVDQGYSGLATKDYADAGVQNPSSVKRNKRTVWTIATMPYTGAHFATMPEKLVEPCILAGCPMGGLVLDPFSGSGTVLAVAARLGRRGVGVDLNPAYHALAKVRTAQRGLRFVDDSSTAEVV